MPKQPSSVLRTLCVAALAGLNVAVVSLFTLWMRADSTAINKSESGSGFDPGQLIPDGNLIWIAAYASLAMLIAVDVCLAILLVRGRTKTA